MPCSCVTVALLTSRLQNPLQFSSCGIKETYKYSKMYQDFHAWWHHYYTRHRCLIWDCFNLFSSNSCLNTMVQYSCVNSCQRLLDLRSHYNFQDIELHYRTKYIFIFMLDDVICNNTGHRCLICDWSNLLSNNPGLNKMLHHSWVYSCHRYLDLSGYYNFQDIELNL